MNGLVPLRRLVVATALAGLFAAPVSLAGPVASASAGPVKAKRAHPPRPKPTLFAHESGRKVGFPPA